MFDDETNARFRDFAARYSQLAATCGQQKNNLSQIRALAKVYGVPPEGTNVIAAHLRFVEEAEKLFQFLRSSNDQLKTLNTIFANVVASAANLNLQKPSADLSRFFPNANVGVLNGIVEVLPALPPSSYQSRARRLEALLLDMRRQIVAESKDEAKFDDYVVAVIDELIDAIRSNDLDGLKAVYAKVILARQDSAGPDRSHRWPTQHLPRLSHFALTAISLMANLADIGGFYGDLVVENKDEIAAVVCQLDESQPQLESSQIPQLESEEVPQLTSGHEEPSSEDE